MKIIKLPDTENSLIKSAIRQDRLAQKELFDRFAPQMLSVCRQYISDFQFAEDTMIIGFTKVFQNLEQFVISKNLKVWIKQIMINESISFLRKRSFEWTESTEDLNITSGDFSDSTLEIEAIQHFLDALPVGYRTVFLLYVVEGYNHQEIAKMLNISEGTSKSQLHKARTWLKNQLTTQNQLQYGR